MHPHMHPHGATVKTTVKRLKKATDATTEASISAAITHPNMHLPERSTDRRPLERLEAVTSNFTEQISREFAPEISRDPKTFKKSILRLVRRQLPPRRGRPNDPRIDAAVRMFEQGKRVKEILRLQIPGFEKVDTYGRYLADKGLRAAIARRRKRSRKASSHN